MSSIEKIKKIKDNNIVLERENKFLKDILILAKNPELFNEFLSVFKEIAGREMPKEFKITNPVTEVEVKNQLESILINNFPEAFKVSNLKDLKIPDYPKSIVSKSKHFPEIVKELGLIKAIGQKMTDAFEKGFKQIGGEVRITNSKPEDAIPVVMTTADRKSFYNIAMQVLGGVGINETLLRDIKTAIEASGSSPATTIGEGNQTVATAGTAVQLSAASVSCRRVFIQAHDSNTGIIVVGGSGVIADSATREGLSLYASQGDWFNISNLNVLYIDSDVNGAKVNYAYEN